MSYQWYKTSKPDNNGELISGATSSTYTPSTLGVGTVYYYAIVTNTNNNVNGSKVVSSKSSAAKIIIDIFATHLINFYNENLDFIETVSRQEGIINPSNIKLGTWYKANETTSITNHNLNGNITFYAISNVQEITNQDELAYINIHSVTLAGKYILLNDIVLDKNGAGFDANGWIPIGPDNSSLSAFTGIFNGNNHKITNLWMNYRPSSNDDVGLFGSAYNAQIKNLGVEIAKGKEVRGNWSVGGIVGRFSFGNITNSYSIGNISGRNHVGGIAGIADGNIVNSYSIGNVTCSNSYTGGIAGSTSGNIVNSYSIGNVKGSDKYTGGIAGYVRGNIVNSYSIGNVRGFLVTPAA
ncbi:MAG: hypothetical protein LBG21_04795 [Campylobacteraceae bacterium]|nr:hypothetical protein [Campylobacteraceae bacterium]